MLLNQSHTESNNMKSVLANNFTFLNGFRNFFYQLKPYSAKFKGYYLTGKWTKVETEAEHIETVSGPGSTLSATQVIREQLPQLFKTFSIRTVVDLPCGDFHWMKEVDLRGIDYQGFDIVQDLIDANISKYQTDNIKFGCLDMIKDEIPKAELIVCRDCLIHYSNKFIIKAIKNMKKSGSSYILTTTYTTVDVNKEIDAIGLSRPINLEKPPFNFPKPIYLIDEKIEEERKGIIDRKSSALWRLDDINI